MMSEPEYTFEAWKCRVRAHELAADIVSVTKQGELQFSKILFEKHFSLEFTGAEIFVDTNLKAIGVKPSNDKTLCFNFHKRGTSATKVLSIRKLLILNNIEPKQYTAKWSNKYGMVIFNYQTLEATQ